MPNEIYIRFYNGRLIVNEDMNAWGFCGPIIGPLTCAQVTYGSTLYLAYTHDNPSLSMDEFIDMPEGCAYVGGRYYGDFCFFNKEAAERWSENYQLYTAKELEYMQRRYRLAAEYIHCFNDCDKAVAGDRSPRNLSDSEPLAFSGLPDCETDMNWPVYCVYEMDVDEYTIIKGEQGDSTCHDACMSWARMRAPSKSRAKSRYWDAHDQLAWHMNTGEYWSDIVLLPEAARPEW